MACISLIVCSGYIFGAISRICICTRIHNTYTHTQHAHTAERCDAPIVAVGFSFGGHVLQSYLGKHADAARGMLD